MVAAGKDGNLERLKCLLEAGADLSLSDNSGQTCLGAARGAGSQEVVTFLLSRGITQ